MLAVTKTVYYCEFCKRHRLTRHAIEKHEPRCLYNPLRSECGWHEGTRPATAPADAALVFKDAPDLDWLRDLQDGCPACMLSVVVQARRLGLSPEEAHDFVYKTEVERFRAAEREERW